MPFKEKVHKQFYSYKYSANKTNRGRSLTFEQFQNLLLTNLVFTVVILQ